MLGDWPANHIGDRRDRSRRRIFFHKTHIRPKRRARFEGGMKKNNGFRLNKEQVLDPTTVAIERMERYCAAHPGSPSAARRPQLFLRSHLWIALLGPSVGEGIVGIGPTIEAALRAFDAQYLAGLRPPAQGLRRGLYNSRVNAPESGRRLRVRCARI